ncbi:hypothetical protein Y032_0266g702 [Ancylostoma ceylanicum]|uniref:Uncharacterized protein n=1 Tax=Ancylostoma ceylanicum TaxID=53326 RepID=A0A016S999_9BILA|nr:hypothetical protein Y032_0266g702 [Ancylostoma ceylanicum]
MEKFSVIKHTRCICEQGVNFACRLETETCPPCCGNIMFLKANLFMTWDKYGRILVAAFRQQSQLASSWLLSLERRSLQLRVIPCSR